MQIYPRKTLPQVTRNHLERLELPFRFLRVSTGSLITSQRIQDLDPEKVRRQEREISDGEVRPLIVDRDFRVVNGHHRLQAGINMGLDTMQVYQVAVSVEELTDIFTANRKLLEGSPDTLAGSFTPDLLSSKRWLADQIRSVVQDRPIANVYVLGSWYGNMGLVLLDRGIRFERLILVEIDQTKLDTSRRILSNLDDQGRLECVCAPAETVKFQNPCLVINTSSNEMSRDWLLHVPQGSLVAIQGRNNTQRPVPTPTSTLWDFDAGFPLKETLFTGRKRYRDPETPYTRFMKIGWA